VQRGVRPNGRARGARQSREDRYSQRTFGEALKSVKCHRRVHRNNKLCAESPTKGRERMTLSAKDIARAAEKVAR
jgi:hypothetical protein